MPKTDWSLFCIAAALFMFFSDGLDSLAQPIRERERGYDFNDPPDTRFQIAPYLSFGAQLEFEALYERNLDLDNENDEDLFTLEPGIVVALSFDPSDHFQAFTSVKFGGDFEFEDGMTLKDDAVLEVEEMYIFFKELLDDTFSLQVGRQQFEDERKWLYDAELDAARAYMGRGGFLAQLSYSRGGLIFDMDLLNKEVDDKVNNYTGYFSYHFNEDTNVAAYVIYRDDTGPDNDSPLYFGIHSDGEATESLDYWVELAYVAGNDGSQDISGVGFDFGGAHAFEVAREPSIPLGYAFGSSEFRQTDLQSNEADFNGVVDFSYYGELFDPNLANLSIVTADAGINPAEEFSIDIVYHYYSQIKASEEFFDVNIDADPDGVHKSVGSEIDLVLGYEQESENLAVEFSLGYFMPGSAFGPEAENAFSSNIVLEYEF